MDSSYIFVFENKNYILAFKLLEMEDHNFI
jgi:hypothetical protein